MNKDQLQLGRELERIIHSKKSAIFQLDKMLDTCSKEQSERYLSIDAMEFGGVTDATIPTSVILVIATILKATMSQQLATAESKFAAL